MKVTILKNISFFAFVAFQQCLLLSVSVESVAASIELEVIHPDIFDPNIHFDLYMEQINHFRNATSFHHQMIEEVVDDVIDEKKGNHVRRMQRCNKRMNHVFGGWNSNITAGTLGTHTFKNGDLRYVKFNIENTNCAIESKNQNAWAYLRFTIDCEMTIEDIDVKGLVNSNDDMTDYLNIFINGNWLAQWSGDPREPNLCSSGNPKVRKEFPENYKLAEGTHDFAIQVATNDGYIHHLNSYYEIQFDTQF